MLIDARYHVIKSRNKYNDFVNKYQYTVLCFVDNDLEFVDRSEKRDHKRAVNLFKKALKSASLTGAYKNLLKHEVGFLLVDVSKRSMVDLDDEFYFKELPACVLLENGEPINFNAKIDGFSTKRDILDFLDRYAEDEIDSLIETRKEEEQLKREERIAQLNAQSMYYGWNPWGGYGPYYYGYGPYAYRGYYNRYPCGYVGFGVVI